MMNKECRKILLFCFCLIQVGLAQQRNQPKEWPLLKPGEKPVCHLAYCLLYSEKHEQAAWVAYKLTAEETFKFHERTNKFLEDPDISTGSASNEDYSGSGFDRGHLAPAADMGWSQQAMEESFYFSNMSPQRPQCNRGIWKKGEEQVRDWARHYGSLYVVTGPVLKDGLPSIGINKVSVPEAYYKILLRPDSLHPAAIALLVPNEGSSEPVQAFAVDIDSVEKLTGFDFFPWLPDAVEKKLEASVCLDCWEWNLKTRGYAPSGHRETSIQPIQDAIDADAYRCHGITKKGLRCKRKVKAAGTNCYQHGG
jgi:endonuclease G